MSRTSPPRSALVLAAGALTVALLGGCSSGQITGTSSQADNNLGGNASAGSIFVVAARFVAETADGDEAFPARGTAPLQARVVNEGSAADRLLSASSSTGPVEVGGTTEIPGGQVLVISGLPESDPDEEETGSDSDSERNDESDEQQEPVEAATAPGGERLAQVVLSDLAEPLRTGLTYQLVLVFEQAGEVTVDVPVSLVEQPRPVEQPPADSE